jgi:hypothetical protein
MVSEMKEEGRGQVREGAEERKLTSSDPCWILLGS